MNKKGVIKHDLTGNVYGRLTVLEFVKIEKSTSYWKCQCSCGNIITTSGSGLKCGHTKSCGCLHKERAGLNFKTHGESKTRFYKIFLGIVNRCTKESNGRYENYGGRGIKCEWDSYEDFKKDMYEEYIKMSSIHGEKAISIDRIDVDKNYCKSNCKWVTDEIQRNNKTNTIYVEMKDGSLMPLKFFSEKYNISYSTLNSRYRRSKYKGTYRIPFDAIMLL